MKFQSWYLWNISTLGTLLNQSDLRTGTNWKKLKSYLSYFNTHLLNWRLLFLGGHNYASMWKVILMPKGSMHLLFLIPWTSWPLNSLSYNRPLWLCHISPFISIYISRHKKLNCLSELIRESAARESLALGNWQRRFMKEAYKIYYISTVCLWRPSYLCICHHLSGTLSVSGRGREK